MAPSSEFAMLYITFPNNAEAKKLARELVRRGMANFVNLLPGMNTYYRMASTEDDSNIEVDTESLVMAKIRQRDSTSVIEYVTKEHPCEIAEIYAVPILQLSKHLTENLKTSLKSAALMKTTTKE